MITILLSMIQLFILYYLIEDRDIKTCVLLIAGIFAINLLTFGAPLYYIRHMFIDVLFCLCAFVLQSNYKRYIFIGICLISYSMNLYEHVSYYQTIFYEYRQPIQWCLFQLLYLVLLYKAKWRALCNMQN